LLRLELPLLRLPEERLLLLRFMLGDEERELLPERELLNPPLELLLLEERW
jgi:hypothetical protein